MDLKKGERYASEIHKEYNVKTPLSGWIKRRINYFSLIENYDYWVFQRESTGGRPMTDYVLSINSSKLIAQKELLKSCIGNSNRREVIFFVKLEEIISQIKNYNNDIIYQYSVGKYKVDAFIPSLNTAIEYDEKHHEIPKNRKKDMERQECIVREINNHNECRINFFRAKEGDDNRNIGKLFQIWAEGDLL